MSHNDSDKDKKNPSHDIRSTVIKQKILRLIG